MSRIDRLRELMSKRGIDVYYVPTADFHNSEFVGEHFKVREYLSGFTGSAGTLIVTMDKAGLWTDGRYFLQAEQQLAGGDITLYKAECEGVPSINDFLIQNLKDNMTLAFDGRCMSAASVIGLKRIFELNKKQVNLVYDVDLADELWSDRPALSCSKAFELEERFAGENSDMKIARVREIMNENNAFAYVITSLDNIGWLLNIRGNDIAYSPLLLAYLIITETNITLYCNNEAVSNITDYLAGINVHIKNYAAVYSDADKLADTKRGRVIIADLDNVNYSLFQKIRKNRVLNMVCPITRLKAVKNNIEIINEAEAHIKDGAAYVKFLYWFNERKVSVSELDIAEKLLEERSKMEGFIEESFAPIVAYGRHGAIVHYSPNKESNVKIEDKSFVLIDTGAHYYEGTTDITRTLACGELTDEEKINYTLVLKGNLALGAATFLYGATGANLDILARQPLWKMGLDYKHGTGHGVGYLMNVHEGPNNIRSRLGKGKNISAVIEDGMITSNEPGVYFEGKYGIRLENMIVCREKCRNEFGRFMQFETLTLVPFDLTAIKVELLDEKEKELLNNYHSNIRKLLLPFLDEKEQEFLMKITEKI